MENQHKLIKGYRDLSEEEIALMNEAKALAEKVGAFVERLEQSAYGPFSHDARWIAIGKTNLQQGFMAIIRAIAKPGTF